MRNRLSIYQGIGYLTRGDIAHLRQHVGSIRPMLLVLFSQLPTVPPLFSGLYEAALTGTHAELVLKMRQINRYLPGEGRY